MIYSIFNYFTGYVSIKIEGLRLEQLLNNSKITFWDVKRKTYTIMYAKVSYLAYLKLIKKTDKYKITLIKEYGLFTVFKRLWKNKVICFGLFLCVGVLILLSNLILHINISGFEKLEDRIVKEYVFETGFKLGSFRWQNDLDKICEHLMSKEEIAWASAGYDGVTLNIVIIQEKLENDDSPSDIVASRRAIINKIEAYNGQKYKEVGDVVEKGDILIGGLVAKEDGSAQKIKARGKVIGTIYETGEFEIDTKNYAVSRTGKTNKETYIEFFSYKSIIEKEDVQFSHYEVDCFEKHIGGQQGILPIKYVEKVYNEVEIENPEIKDVMEKCEQMAFDNATKKLPKDAMIVDKNVKFEVNGGKIKAIMIVEANVPIGVNVKL